MPSSLQSASSLVSLLSLVVVACGGSQGTGAPPKVPSPAPMGQMAAGASKAEGNNMFWNTGFEEGTLEPWASTVSSAKGSVAVVNQEACFNLEGGGANAYDVLIRQRQIGILSGHKYQVRFKVHSTAPTKLRPKVSKAGPPYTEYWSALVESSSTPQTFAGSFDASADDEAAEFVIHLGGDLTGQTPLTVCLDDIELNDPEFKIPEERSAKPLTAVRVNQLGYLPSWPKIATIKSTATEPVEWQLVDAGGKVVASGKTKPFGEDKAAGELVHNADFSSFTQPGKGYKLKVGADESYPFDIAPDVYKKLKYDSLAFYYLQRSGIDIKMPYAGAEKWARPAGHVGDKSVPCAPEAKCKYSLDVSGGWYDAGDHGKYLVNGGISVWTLQNEYETLKHLGRTADDFGDGKMSVPENKNGKPDLLDETRFEMEWMLKMQVPAGQPMAGMAHHKIHGEKWSRHPDHAARRRHQALPASGQHGGHAEPRGRGRAGGASLEDARSGLLEEMPARRGNRLPGGQEEPERDRRTPDRGRRHLRRFALRRRVLLGRGRALHHDRQARVQGCVREVAFLQDDSDRGRRRNRLHELGSRGGSRQDQPGGGTEQPRRGRGAGAAQADHRRRRQVPRQHPEARLPDAARERSQVPLGLERVRGQRHGDLRARLRLHQGRGSTRTAWSTAWTTCSAATPRCSRTSRAMARGHSPTRTTACGRTRRTRSTPGPRPASCPAARTPGLEDPYAKQVGLPGCSPQKCFVDHIESWSTNEIAINWNAPLAWAAAFLDEIGKGK